MLNFIKIAGTCRNSERLHYQLFDTSVKIFLFLNLFYGQVKNRRLKTFSEKAKPVVMEKYQCELRVKFLQNNFLEFSQQYFDETIKFFCFPILLTSASRKFRTHYLLGKINLSFKEKLSIEKRDKSKLSAF